MTKSKKWKSDDKLNSFHQNLATVDERQELEYKYRNVLGKLDRYFPLIYARFTFVMSSLFYISHRNVLFHVFMFVFIFVHNVTSWLFKQRK